MKIAYIYSTLSTKGGTERMITEKANYLADHFGYDVTIITCIQHPDENNSFYTSNKVKQIKLGFPYFSQYKYKYPKRLWVKYAINKEFRRILTKEVQQINPNILIGIGHFKADFVCNIECEAKIIVECHEARYFAQSGMSQHQNLISKLFQHFYRKKFFRTIEKKADAVVTLTQGDKELWNKAKRIEVIPNFSIMPIHHTSKCEGKRVIAVGRLSWEKGYDRLIEIWKIVELKYPDWFLDIYGEGELEKDLKDDVVKKNIKNITFHKFTDKISDEYTKSSICVMTSYYEGFALVLLEALRHGVPCIAFNCPFGPSSIIEDNRCGYLIENGNINLFAEKLSTLIENAKLRKVFSEAAIIRAEAFTIDRIMEQWKYLFESLK